MAVTYGPPWEGTQWGQGEFRVGDSPYQEYVIRPVTPPLHKWTFYKMVDGVQKEISFDVQNDGTVHVEEEAFIALITQLGFE